MKKFLAILTVVVVCFCGTLAHAGPCEDGYDQIQGSLVLEFAPDVIGWHGFDYQISGSLNGWPLTVYMYWQSDTYPGWHLFRTLYNDMDEFTWFHSETDDNVRYRVEFWTNSSNAYADWLFCKFW